MSHFQTRVKNFFAIRENFFSRRPFGRSQLVGANSFMRLFDPTVKHFSAKNFTELLHTDCLFNQHTEKTQKILDKFLCLFLFAFSFFRQSRPSPLPSAEKCAHFLQKHRIPPDLKDRSAAMDLLLSSFRQRYKTKKGARRLPCHALSMAMPRRHSFPAAPGDDGGLSPAFPFPRRAEPDDASSGRKSERSCPPARPR